MLANSGDSLELQEFVTLLTASQGKIRAFIVTLMPGSPDVGDVVQETNIVLWKSRSRFRPGSNFLAWAFTIARLEVLHQRSRTKRYGRILISEELLDMLAAEIPAAENPDQYLDALQKCKSKLTATQRKLIDFRYQQGCSIEDYAQQTGKNAPALRMALMRTRTILRECIEMAVGGRTA